MKQQNSFFMFIAIFAILSISAFYSPLFPVAQTDDEPYKYADMIVFDSWGDKNTSVSMFSEVTNNSNARTLFNETDTKNEISSEDGIGSLFFWRPSGNMPGAWDTIFTMDGSRQGMFDGSFIHYETDWDNATDTGFFTYDNPHDSWGPDYFRDSHIESQFQNSTYGIIFPEMMGPAETTAEFPLDLWEFNIFDNITLMFNRTITYGLDTYIIGGEARDRNTTTVLTTAYGVENYSSTLSVPLGPEFEATTPWADLYGNVTVEFLMEWSRTYDSFTGEVLSGVESQIANINATYLNTNVDITFDNFVFPTTITSTISGQYNDYRRYNVTDVQYKPAPEGTAPLMDGDQLVYDSFGTSVFYRERTESDTSGFSVTDTHTSNRHSNGQATVQIYGHNGPDQIWAFVYGNEHVVTDDTSTSSNYPDPVNEHWENDFMFADVWGQMQSTSSHELPYENPASIDLGKYFMRDGPMKPDDGPQPMDIYQMMLPPSVFESDSKDWFIDMPLTINGYTYNIHATAFTTEYNYNAHNYTDFWDNDMHYMLSYDTYIVANNTAAWDTVTGALVLVQENVYVNVHAYGTFEGPDGVQMNFDGVFTIDTSHKSVLSSHPRSYQTPPTTTSTSDTTSDTNTSSATNSSDVPTLDNPLPFPMEAPVVFTAFVAIYAIRKRK